ncbi:MAG: Site-specific recombinase [Candidatus Nomurabacteria bacterium GW2011_GWB1_37_5]|uniref:Site-specific recombinase n=1 Tax=Candidatus Nomurabacteria bacterium GW2011_GWB1_37_5 TaxID=1618742 RepID=A0A0G0H9T1_9BACT|nr:MAG: Site-specific recombinase [Candidatus Nomurabacteria bacterium GW2011_GWB1_37_5]
MKGIIYIRVSSDEQVKGTSLDDQLERCKKFCNEKGITIIKVFREEGASAKSTDRKVFLEAVEFCRTDKIDAFVVWKVDRFARNVEDHFAVRATLAKYKTTLFSVTEPIGNEPAEKLFEIMLAGFAEFDNSIRKTRCSNGMLARIKQGIYPWKPPIGYICANHKKNGEKKTEPDKPDEQIFPLIQNVLKDFSKGIFTQTDIANKLNELGLDKIRGQKTDLRFVDRILGKYLKFYAGIICNSLTNNEDINGLHKPMITKEEMYQIQLIRAGKFKMLKRDRHNPEFPLRRTVICAFCSNPLTGSISHGNGGKYSYYHCFTNSCPMYKKTLPKVELEKDFIKYLEEITPKEKFLNIFKESILDLWQEKGRQSYLEAQKHEKQLSILENKRKKVFEMREEGSYTKEEFLERKAEVENEIMSTKISLSEARIDQFDIEGVLVYANNFISNLGKQWFDLSPQLRPRFQKLVFPEGLLHERGKGFHTTKLGCIYELNQQCSGKKSQVVDPSGLEPLTSSLQKRRSTR